MSTNSFSKVISSSGVNIAFRMLGLGTSFLTTLIITNLFGVDVFGNYSLVFTISQATAMIFGLGVPNALVKLTGNNNLTFLQAKKVLIKGIKITLLFSVIPILFFWIGSDYLAEKIYENPNLSGYLYAVILSLPLFIMHELFLYFFIATKKFIRYNICMFVLPNILLIVFLYIFHTLGYAEHYTFIAFAIAILLVVAVEVLLIFELNPQKETAIISSKQLLKQASPLMFSGLMVYLLNWTDVLMLGMTVSEEDVGIYNIAYKVGSAGFLVIVSVNTIIMPRMAELYGKGDLPGLKKLIHNSTRLIALLSVPIVMSLIVLSPFILSFFGDEAIKGAPTLIIIALGILFSAVCGNTDQILNMTGNEKIFRNITFVSVFLNVVLNIALIPFYGINGAALASLATNIVLNVLSLWYVRKKLGFYTLF